MSTDPFALDELPRLIRPLIRRLTGLDACRRVYRDLATSDRPAPFSERVLDELQIAVSADVSSDPLPAAGPVVIVANHPHGMVDGLALVSLCRRTRPDVRVVANHLLARIPELHEFCFFVDPFARILPPRRAVLPDSAPPAAGCSEAAR